MVGRNSIQFYSILIMSNRATIYFLPSWFLSFFKKKKKNTLLLLCFSVELLSQFLE